MIPNFLNVINFERHHARLFYYPTNPKNLTNPSSDNVEVVYRARAMYAMIDPEKTYDDEMICLSQGIFYRQQKPEVTLSSFRMFPNPAFDQITVNYQIAEDQRAYLLIRNSLGQALQEFTLDGKKREINFNIQALMNGIYTVQLILEGQVSHQGKLVILR